MEEQAKSMEGAKKLVRSCQVLFESFVKGIYSNIARFEEEDMRLSLTEEGEKILGDAVAKFPPLAKKLSSSSSPVPEDDHHDSKV